MWLKKKLLDTFGVWRVPASISIEDWRLGAIYWSLRLAVLVYILGSLFLNGGYLYQETPTGYPTFWFSYGDLFVVQNQTDAAPYCDKSDYNYYMHQEENEYWNQLDIACFSSNYGDIAHKTVKSGFVTTMFKRLHTNKVPCSDSVDPCSAVSSSPGWRQYEYKIGRECSCAKQQDYFTLGVEKMLLSIEHAFTTSTLFDESSVEGSSSYEKAEDSRKIVKTCVQKAGGDKSCIGEFGPGEVITYSIEKWLELAGINLDERLSSKVQVDVKNGMYPQRRSTGAKVHVSMSYEGSLSDDVVVCTITVSVVDGWNSYGATMNYAQMQSATQEFREDYQMGISFEFFPVGVMSRFDWESTFGYLIGGFVMMAIVDVIVGFVAFYILPEKDVYQKAQTTKLEYGKALAQFGVSTALACHAFKQWDRNQEEGKEPKLSRAELVQVFSGPFDHKTAVAFANTMTKEVGRDSLVCADLVNLMSDGLVSVNRLKDRDAKEAKSRDAWAREEP